MPFDYSIYHTNVLSARSWGMSPLSQMKKSVDTGGPLNGEKVADTAVILFQAITDGALCYVTKLMFDLFRSLVFNRKLYSEE